MRMQLSILSSEESYDLQSAYKMHGCNKGTNVKEVANQLYLNPIPWDETHTWHS